SLPARTNPAEPAYSPTENVPLNSRSEFVPVRCNCFPAVERSASPLDFARPRLVNAFLICVVKTLEQAGSDLGTVMFGKTQDLFQQSRCGVSHASVSV